MSQVKAAQVLDVTRARAADLLRGKIVLVLKDNLPSSVAPRVRR
jgi:predicted XRE-type DNA-binding protein